MILRGKNLRGLSLAEIMVALFILISGMTLLMTVFRSASLETAFTSEHYTAMFLAQKVMEDINAMLRHNPYGFSELIAKGEGTPQSVVKGESPYFRLLENTRNYGYLSEIDDDPIKEGALFDQLRKFTVQVSTRFQPDPVTGEMRTNLLQVFVTVRWKTNEGADREYLISQFLFGHAADAFKTLPEQVMTPALQNYLDTNAVIQLALMFGLATESVTFNSILAANPDADPVALKNLGRVSFLSQLGESIENEFKDKISTLEDERDALKDMAELSTKLRFADLQRKIASMYEQKAVRHIGSLLMLKQPMRDLIEALESNPPKEDSIGIFGTLDALKEFIERIHATSGKVFLTIRMIPMSLSCAENIYLTLVNPPYLELIPQRQEPAFFRKVLDIQKIGVLSHDNDTDAFKLLEGLRANISAFRAKYDGKFQHFLKFLDKEAEIAGNLAVLRDHYKAITDVFAYINSLDKEVERLKKALPAPKTEEEKDKEEEEKKKKK